jgi:hypothetical protein
VLLFLDLPGGKLNNLQQTEGKKGTASVPPYSAAFS